MRSSVPCSQVMSFMSFVETECSLQCSPNAAILPHPEPHLSTPHPYTALFRFYFNIVDVDLLGCNTVCLHGFATRKTYIEVFKLDTMLFSVEERTDLATFLRHFKHSSIMGFLLITINDQYAKRDVRSTRNSTRGVTRSRPSSCVSETVISIGER